MLKPAITDGGSPIEIDLTAEPEIAPNPLATNLRKEMAHRHYLVGMQHSSFDSPGVREAPPIIICMLGLAISAFDRG